MTTDERHSLRLGVPCDLRELPGICHTIGQFLATLPIDAHRRGVAEVLVEEVLTNVVRHGGRDSRVTTIDVEVVLREEGLLLRVVDDGIEFDPLDAPAFDPLTPLERRTGGGMGIHLMRSFARNIHHERRDGRNRLELLL